MSHKGIRRRVHCIQAVLFLRERQAFSLLDLASPAQTNLLIEYSAQSILGVLNLRVEDLPLFSAHQGDNFACRLPELTLPVLVPFKYLLLATDQKSSRPGTLLEHGLHQQHRQFFFCDHARNFVGGSIEF